MKRLFAIVALAGAGMLNGCASHNDELSTTHSGATVPGEKVSESSVDPQMGPGGAGANVHF